MAGPYQREVYDNSRATGRIADLIARRGDTQARLALERGDIAARNAQNLGGIVSGTLSSLVKMSADERERKQAEARQAEADARRKVEQGRQDAAYMQQQDASAKQGMESSAVSGALRQNDKGVWSYDMDALAEGLKRSGLGDRLPAIQARLQEAEVSTMKFELTKQQLAQHRATTLGNLAAGVKEAGNSPEAFTMASTLAVKNGILSEEEIAPYMEQIKKDPTSVGALTTQLMRQAGIKAEKPQDAPKAGTFEDFVVRAAREKGVKPEQLSTTDIAGLRRTYEASGRAPEKPKDDGITPSARAVAKRTFDNAVTDAEAAFAAAKRAALRTPESADMLISEAEDTRDRAIRRARATFYETTMEAPAIGMAGGSVKAGANVNTPRPAAPVPGAPPAEPRMGRTPGQAAPGGGVVQMRLPDGRVVPIYADKVEEAKRRGAVEVR